MQEPAIPSASDLRPDPMDRPRDLGLDVPIRVGVYGAAGFAGSELVRMMVEHPFIDLAFAASRSHAGKSLPGLEPGAPPVELLAPHRASASDTDVIISCKSHGDLDQVVGIAWCSNVPVIDLSGDLSLRDPDLHRRLSGFQREPALVDAAVHGVPELYRDSLGDAKVVALPGAYTTCAALALAPLVRAGLLATPVVIDGKQGASGLAREPHLDAHFCTTADDVRPSEPGRDHREVAVMEQLFDDWIPPASEPVRVIFNPHWVPIVRGMMITIVARTPGREAPWIRQFLAEYYSDEPFVWVHAAGESARIRDATGTNRAVIGVHPVAGEEAVVITCAIDDLMKGSAGQALQCLNLLFGLPEGTGLPGATHTAA